ncbi:helix-turn-helix domain-containing protein [Viridibacillus sp. NPDC093762]|uniref:helix-turn-helix domain-containing protein n=1 Tax=Viridibacillus sp. NPDC093762 TaxID=3390720 RepID=UPI003D009B4F
MAKVRVEQRIQAVQRYLNGYESMREIAKDIGVTDRVVNEWVRRYQENGIETFLKSYTKYSAEYKMNVLNYMNETGTSSINAAALFNISSPGMIRNWKMKFEIGGYDALVSKKKGRPSMKKETKRTTKPISAKRSVEALEARIKQLEMENAYLKKLNTLVQKQEKLPIKSKRK